MEEKLITVYCSGSDGNLIPLSYSGKYYTVDTAEEAVRNHGFTVIYSTTK
jgi:hypothetical protein